MRMYNLTKILRVKTVSKNSGCSAAHMRDFFVGRLLIGCHTGLVNSRSGIL